MSVTIYLATKCVLPIKTTRIIGKGRQLVINSRDITKC